MRRWGPGALVALAVAAAVVAWGARLHNGAFVYSLWTDRDLVRAAEALREWPTLGAEVSGRDEARLPGGAWALLLAPVVWWDGDPGTAWRWVHLLHGFAAFVVAWAAAFRHGAVAGAAAAAALVMAPLGWEVRATLWNPSGLDLFAALTLAGLTAASRGQREGWWVAGLCLGIAVQIHASVVAWALPAAVTAGWLGGARGAWGLAVAATATFVPYLVADGAAGWANARHLWGGGPGMEPQVGAGMTRLWELLGHAPEALGYRDLWAWAMAPWWLAAASGAWALASPRARPEGTVTLVGLGLGMPAIAVSHGPALMSRYLEAFLPLMAVLVGVAVAELARRGWALGAAALGVVLAPGWLLWPALVHDPGRTAERWPELGRMLDDVASSRGWDLAEAASRTVIAQWSEDEVSWRPTHGIAWLLRRRGLTEVGARPGPCVLLLLGGPGPRRTPDAAVLEATVGPGATLLSATELEERVWRLDWDRPGWCPSSLLNRYVDHPEEAPLRSRFGELRCGEVVAAGPGRVLGGLDLGTAPEGVCTLMGVDVSLAPAPGALSVTLVAPALRGHAFFGGWFRNARLRDARVVLHGAAGTVAVPLGDLGWRLAPTPVRTEARVPAGVWRARLVGILEPVTSLGEIGPGQPRELDLGEVIVP